MMRAVQSGQLTGRWVVKLRWWACAVQVLVILALWASERWQGPWGWLLLAAALTGGSNWVWVTRPPAFFLADFAVVTALVIDVFVLTLLLAFSGGPSNPFSILYLVYVTLAAVVVGGVGSWVVMAASAIGYAALFFVGSAGHHHGAHAELDSHLQGMLLAYVIAAAVISLAVGRLSRALETRTQELIEAREISAKNERLAALGTLVAGATHELATPLGSIALAADEMARKANDPLAAADLAEDARLVVSEARRCRQILDRLGGRAGEWSGEAFSRISARSLIEETQARLGPDSRVIFEDPPEDNIWAPRGPVVEALLNLIKNALDASGTGESVRVGWRSGSEGLALVVQDRGSGMGADVLARAGEPFFTTKPQGRGMGLGLFLVRSLADRLGGRFVLESSPGRGTTAMFYFPPGGENG